VLTELLEEFLITEVGLAASPGSPFDAIRRANRYWLAFCRANQGLMRGVLQVGDELPKFAKLGSSYVSDPDTPRTYTIRDRSDKPYKAYRMVVQAPGFGQYYGIQGTNWMSPPIIDNPDEERRMRGRTYELFYDGRSLRLVAWRTPRAVYWVSNTLSESLTNKQMLGIARSLSRIGA